MAPPLLETDLDEAAITQNNVCPVNGQNGDYVSYAAAEDFLPPPSTSEMSPLLFEKKLETLFEESPNKSVEEEEPKYAQVKLKRNNVIENQKNISTLQ